jgi:uncharacterized protein (DUF697 family)
MSDKEDMANELVTYYSKWAMGAGSIPLPLADLAAVTGVQIQMLSRLSELYGVPFSENSVKSIIASLVGGLIPSKFGWSAGYVVASTVKSFPVVGTLLGIGTVAVVAGASTYAVGKVFVRHFEQGGTFLSFDSAKVKEYFKEQYGKGAEVVKGSKRAASATKSEGATAEPA